MKKAILFLLIISSATVQGQTLKELLYSGKLKQDSTGVIRKTDDLKSKIDTSQKKTEPEKPKVSATVGTESPKLTNNPNTANVPTTSSANTTASAANTATSAPATATPAAPVKSNNKIWKEYTDSLAISLKTDVLSSKKVKKETYYFTVEYEIGTDGATTISNITVSPENHFLVAHMKQRLETESPRVTPVLNSAGQPQKAKRRYTFFITKE